tara:strand:+ start:1555 stop:2499 length:945 start_codon:yes stop_codon:yes gene_type:complete
MAGILDVKKRILDAIVTVEGRRQLAKEEFNIRFASFSDEGIFYDSENGVSARNISNLLVFEVASLPRDTIIPEIDNEGSFSLSLSDGNKIVNGRKVISGSYDVVTVDSAGRRTVVKATPIVTGTLGVYAGSKDIMNTSMNNFSQLNIIGTDDGLLESTFAVNKNKINLDSKIIKASLSSLKPMLFNDSLNRSVQTRYLSPYTQIKPSSNRKILGHYPKFTKEPYNNFEALKNQELKDCLSKDEVFILSNASSNNILAQVFEINKSRVDKLSIIDYGEFRDRNNSVHRVFYLGKPIRDSNGTAKFCRLFTMVFEK